MHATHRPAAHRAVPRRRSPAAHQAASRRRGPGEPASWGPARRRGVPLTASPARSRRGSACATAGSSPNRLAVGHDDRRRGSQSPQLPPVGLGTPKGHRAARPKRPKNWASNGTHRGTGGARSARTCPSCALRRHHQCHILPCAEGRLPQGAQKGKDHRCKPLDRQRREWEVDVDVGSVDGDEGSVVDGEGSVDDAEGSVVVEAGHGVGDAEGRHQQRQSEWRHRGTQGPTRT